MLMSEDQVAAMLQERVRRLEGQLADLEGLLAAATAHHDGIQRELLGRVRRTVDASAREIQAMQDRIDSLEDEKADLETIVEAAADHGDAVEEDLMAQRRRLEARLRQACKLEAIGTFAAGIAHDFNNILSAIAGYTQLCLGLLPESSPAVQPLRKVLAGEARAKDLIGQILTFARNGSPDLQPVDVAAVAQEAANLVRPVLAPGIRFQLELPDQACIVQGDPTQIHQVLMNLCTNAADAMRDTGGELAIRLSRLPDWPADGAGRPESRGSRGCVCLVVADTGHGIPREILESIFDPFFTTKVPGQGTGLGLAMVQGIVQGHRGEIDVESEPGRGTRFRICLPCAAPGPVSPAAARPS